MSAHWQAGRFVGQGLVDRDRTALSAIDGPLQLGMSDDSIGFELKVLPCSISIASQTVEFKIDTGQITAHAAGRIKSLIS